MAIPGKKKEKKTILEFFSQVGFLGEVEGEVCVLLTPFFWRFYC
jgi:hypothetical protein